jgi:predicted nucleic acid-binding protein
MNLTAPIVVALDSNVIINFNHAKALGVLAKLPGFSFVAPEEVQNEMMKEKSRDGFALAEARGWLSVVSLDEIEEQRWNLEAKLLIQKGEAACLALARSRGYHVACDERRKYDRLAVDWIGRERMLNTVGLVVLMIREGLLSVAEADGYLEIWKESRFAVRFRSFQELVGD